MKQHYNVAYKNNIPMYYRNMSYERALKKLEKHPNLKIIYIK